MYAKHQERVKSANKFQYMPNHNNKTEYNQSTPPHLCWGAQ